MKQTYVFITKTFQIHPSNQLCFEPNFNESNEVIQGQAG